MKSENKQETQHTASWLTYTTFLYYFCSKIRVLLISAHTLQESNAQQLTCNTYTKFYFVTENSLRIRSNVPGDIILENETIRYTCDVRYAGNIVPSMNWTASSSPDQLIPKYKQNSPGLARTIINITGNVATNGKIFICTMFFEAQNSESDYVATNAPDCNTSREAIPLSVHCKYFANINRTQCVKCLYKYEFLYWNTENVKIIY